MFQGRGRGRRNYFKRQFTNRRESNIKKQEVEKQELKQKPRLTTRTQARLTATTKLRRQNLKADLLSKATEDKNPPRGLTPRINPKLPNPKSTWFIQWEEHQYQAGLSNTQMLVNYWTGRKKELAADLQTTTKLLEKDLDPEQKEEVQRRLGEVPSYIKDTTDIINKLENTPVTDEDILCTIDVSALYLHIPHHEWLEAIKRHMLSQGIHRDMATFIRSLAEKVLTINYFLIQHQLYLSPRYCNGDTSTDRTTEGDKKTTESQHWTKNGKKIGGDLKNNTADQKKMKKQGFHPKNRL
jgi:hypothetical protein